MKKYYSIGEAAKAAHMTTETLRHYDRIGLVKPTKTDPWTKYRYYTGDDIIRLQTIRALQSMDLSLHKIQEVLEFGDLERIIDFFKEAEENADKKIELLQTSKKRIQAARASYEKKILEHSSPKDTFIEYFPPRVILLSNTLTSASLDTLWNYLSHFYDAIDPSLKNQFSFEDLAGIYTEDGISRLFAVCIRFADIEGLKKLPEGWYLCAEASEEDRERILEQSLQMARDTYHAHPSFFIQLIVVSGILQWRYQIQIYLGSKIEE